MYTQELFSFLTPLVEQCERAWDCGTGNGQLAVLLSEFFTHVYATDMSENQIRNAVQRQNIIYKIEPAERTEFPDAYFDLVSVAQAIHWFDFDKFYTEVSRVLKPRGILVVIGYHLPLIDPETDALVTEFYSTTLEGYWDRERKYIDELYRTLPFPFEEINAPQFFSYHRWDCDSLLGFLGSWSAVQHYKKAHGRNPVELLEPKMRSVWNDNIVKEVCFPILLRVGKK